MMSSDEDIMGTYFRGIRAEDYLEDTLLGERVSLDQAWENFVTIYADEADRHFSMTLLLARRVREGLGEVPDEWQPLPENLYMYKRGK